MSWRSLSDYQQKWPIVARLERMLHRRMDALVGNSRAVVAQLISEGVPESKVRLIYNGIEASEPLPPRPEARQELGLDENALVGVVVANFIHYKGHQDLIRGFGARCGTTSFALAGTPCRLGPGLAGWAGKPRGGRRNCRQHSIPRPTLRRSALTSCCGFRIIDLA